jgi:ArsR family transcriptional regulator, arsenate/arsenite/antimonite-responsive transcriptional repressor
MPSESSLSEMPVVPTPLGEVEARRLALRLQALADPTRLRIITALDSVCVPVGTVVEATEVVQPTVSHHLRVLRDAGLVEGERRGQQVFYCLVDNDVVDLVQRIRDLELVGAS